MKIKEERKIHKVWLQYNDNTFGFNNQWHAFLFSNVYDIREFTFLIFNMSKKINTIKINW